MAKILIVDDMTGIRLSLSVVLSGCGHETIEASDGKKALEIMERANDIDLIITDILMPVADGIELMTELNNFEKKPKIIAITGGGNKIDVQYALETAQCFADCVIRKPFQREEIVREVEQLLKN